MCPPKLLLVCFLLVVFPAAGSKESPYETLGVTTTATAKEIRKAYRKLALTYHPDKAQSTAEVSEFEERFVQIANAYETLIDPEKREKYDRGGWGAEEATFQ